MVSYNGGWGGGSLNYYNITIKIYNKIRVLSQSPEQEWSVHGGGGLNYGTNYTKD